MDRSLITQLGYVGIGVADIAAWEDFGTNVLGMQLYQKLDNGTLYLRMDEYSHRFVIEPTGEDDIKYAGWMAPTVNALKEVQARVTAAGVKVEEGSPEECLYRKVNRFITFQDPDGLRLEVFVGLDVDANKPFHSPRAISGFRTGDMGVGHIVPVSKDLQATERFYVDVLGFRVSDYLFNRPDAPGQHSMTFFHVNARHHSFAIGRGRGGNTKRLTHWMMEVNNIHDVGLTYDVVRKRGIPRTMEIGGHLNDHMTSFYMRTPSGFAVEYGWNGREVDDNTWVIQQYHTGDIWGHERMGTYTPQEVAAMDAPAGRRG